MKVGHVAVATVLSITTAWSSAHAQSRSGGRRHNDVSPIHQVEPHTRDHHHHHAAPGPRGVRSIDGSGNHVDDAEHNATYTALARTIPARYDDGVSALAASGRPSARDVSNRVNAQAVLVPNPFGTSDYLWQWGQFLDHDIDLTEGTDPPEFAHISVPAGDPYFDPAGTGTVLIPFNRSIYDGATGTDPSNPRQQLNEISGWIDGSNVYGSDPVRAAALRTHDGTGRLATGPGDLLPDSDGTLPNATGGSSQVMFLAGDIRANEQLGLTALHTLFVREHNRMADEIRRADPQLDGDAVYERARRLVGALIQVITYEEFLPALLGPDALEPYRGYDPDADARILNEFSTAAYRFGHSALPPRLLRLDEGLDVTADGHVALRDAFFNPDRIRHEGGIEPLLRGLAHQLHQRIDVLVIDDVRNFLFGPPGAGGFDLAALNIQRGRDHGLCSYNDAREAYGFPRATDFADISADPEVQSRLAAAYASVDDVDLWVGGLAEDPTPPSQVGPLVQSILVDQFTALRDGDRFWYERTLGRRALDRVRGTRLADVIRRNTDIGREIPDDVFRVVSGERPHRLRDPRRGGGKRGGR
jgi:peroxidase